MSCTVASQDIIWKAILYVWTLLNTIIKVDGKKEIGDEGHGEKIREEKGDGG